MDMVLSLIHIFEVLESFLGFTNMHKAFLFGVGSLGAALLRDSGLHHFGLDVYKRQELQYVLWLLQG